MSGDHNHPRRIPVGKVIVVLVILGIAVIWSGVISSPIGAMVAGTLGVPDLDSSGVTAEDLETGQKTINLPYVLRGKPGLIRFDAYQGVNDYLSTKYPALFRDDHDYWLQFTDESIQDRYLKQLAGNIRAAEADRENQARAAISMVQKIEYADY